MRDGCSCRDNASRISHLASRVFQPMPARRALKYKHQTGTLLDYNANPSYRTCCPARARARRGRRERDGLDDVSSAGQPVSRAGCSFSQKDAASSNPHRGNRGADRKYEDWGACLRCQRHGLRTCTWRAVGNRSRRLQSCCRTASTSTKGRRCEGSARSAEMHTCTAAVRRVIQRDGKWICSVWEPALSQTLSNPTRSYPVTQ